MWIDRRWLVIAAALSILLNIFLAGLVGGHVYAGRKRALPPGDRGPLVPWTRVRQLPTDEKKLFTEAMKAHRQAIIAARRLQIEAREVLAADLAAPAYDKAKAAADFAAFRDAGQRVLKLSNEAVVDALGTLTPASRAAVVNQPVH